MSPRITARRRFYYCFILALPAATFLALVATARWQTFWDVFWRAFHGERFASTEPFDGIFGTGALWILSTLPLTLTAWTLGRGHTAARRLNYELIVGIREVIRGALGREPSPAESEAFARPPKDRAGVALFLGGAFALLVPTFFMAFAPELRTRAGAIWLSGAGMLMGTMVYCQRRASAYLLEEPRNFDFFREFRLLNPNRYAAPGRRFVRVQLACMLTFAFWWLGGGGAFFS